MILGQAIHEVRSQPMFIPLVAVQVGIRKLICHVYEPLMQIPKSDWHLEPEKAQIMVDKILQIEVFHELAKREINLTGIFFPVIGVIDKAVSAEGTFPPIDAIRKQDVPSVVHKRGRKYIRHGCSGYNWFRQIC